MHPTKISFAPCFSIRESAEVQIITNLLILNRENNSTKLQQGMKQSKQDTNQNEIYVTSAIIIHLF